MKKILIKIKNIFKNFWLKFKNTDFYSTYKEEMIGIPILILFFYMINFIFISIFPNGAFFDFASNIETIVYSILKYMIAVWAAHFMIRISFPIIYKHLHDKIYHNFDNLSDKDKNNYSVIILLIFILTAGLIF